MERQHSQPVQASGYQLPDEPLIYQILRNIEFADFELKVIGLFSLGAGVAYGIESKDLTALHRNLKTLFLDFLIPQDRQSFRPHVMVQNKVSPEAAKELLAQLSGDIRDWTVTAVGLSLWRYPGGPWESVAI